MLLVDQRYVKLQYAVVIGSLIFLLVVTCINTNPLFLDEEVFVKNMSLFKQYGLSEKFLIKMCDQAPGPLYQMVQTAFEPLTALKSPGIRLVNVFFFVLIIVNTRIVLRFIKIAEHTSLIALNLIAVPVIWQVAGMALTEVPAMFFTTASVLVLGILVQRSKKVDLQGITLAVLAGVCLGFAILGRTQFLMLIPAVAVLAYNPLADRANKSTTPLTFILIYLATSLAICLPVFLAWDGLVPPQQVVIAQGGLKIWHGVLAFAYTGIIVLLIAPKWFIMNRKILTALAIGLVVFSIMNLFWLKVQHKPMLTFLSHYVPAYAMHLYPVLISPILMVFAAYFLYNLLFNIIRHRNDAYYMFIALSLAFVLTTCVRITHLFTSRYVAQAVPFLIVLLAEKDTFGKWKILRLLLGIILGFISLQTYVYP